MIQELWENSRRRFIKQGAGLFAFAVAGGVCRLTAAEARAAQIPLRTLDRSIVPDLESLGETLLPGSAAAGLAHFIDVQLSGSPADSMLMIKYVGVSPPYSQFYTSGLMALENAARLKFSRSFAALRHKDKHDLVSAMAKADPAGWQGPPGE